MKQLTLLIASLVCLSLPSLAHEKKNSLCSKGLSQSPVNIETVTQAKMPPLNFNYQEIDMHVYNALPTNFFAEPKETLYLEIDTVRYPLKNIHLHNPSEHRITGHQFPMEIHFVHTTLEGKQVIVAQMATIGKRNPALDTMLLNFARGVNQTEETGIQFALDVNQLMAPFHRYYKYEGSETYGACEEDVTWYILKDGIEISHAQVEQLRNLVGINSRVPQPLKGRTIYSWVAQE